MKKIIATVVGVYVAYQVVSIATAIAVAGVNAGVETIRHAKMRRAAKEAAETKKKGEITYLETYFTD